MDEIKKVLSKDEKILWSDKPIFSVYLIKSFSFYISFCLLILILLYSLFIYTTFKFQILNKSLLNYFTPIIIVFGIIISIILFISFIVVYFNYKYTYYAITNSRVIIQRGIIGRDYNTINFNDITNADVNVGVIDKLLNKNTGNIKIFTASTPTYIHTKRGIIHGVGFVLHSIANPYETIKLIKK